MAPVLMFTLITSIIFAEVLQITLAQGNQDTSLCAALIVPNGYPCEEITVPTADGFLLGMQNIPFGIAGANNVSGPPVLLMHGLLASGDNFVVNSPERSLGFILADAGFDVYIGNNRNVQWSHGNSEYSGLQRAYWDWTFDELAAFDVPAMVDYIYERRGGAKLFYVGHSQGTLLLFAGLIGGGTAAEQMKDKLRGGVFMAPVPYLDNLSAPLTDLVLTVYADQIFPLLGVGPADYRLIIHTVCEINSDVCGDVLIPSILGRNSYVADDPTYVKYFPQLTSSYNLNHYGQVKRSGEFRKYDGGLVENLRRYGRLKPPLYDLAKFPSASFPQLFFSGGIDQLSDPRDTERLLQGLPNAGNRQLVTLPDYGHADFVVGSTAYLDLYPQIVSFFQEN